MKTQLFSYNTKNGNWYISVTFNHKNLTFDFEKLFIQSIFNENKLKSITEKFNSELKDISNLSSIKIYKHKSKNLSNKAELIKEIPTTLEFENIFLNKLKYE